MTPPDEHAEALLADLMTQTGQPEGAIRAIASSLTGAAQHDRGMQWELCKTWGLAWEELELVKALRIEDLNTIAQGLAARGFAIAGLAQKMLMERLVNKGDLGEAKILSGIGKQQFDLGKAATSEQPAQQHLHIHGNGNMLETLRELRLQRETQRPAVERLRERGVNL